MSITLHGRKFAFSTTPRAILNNIFDHAYYMADALNLSGQAAADGIFVGTVPDAKGGQSLGAYAFDQDVNAAPAATATQPASGGKFRIAGSGYIDHDNQPGPYYTHQFDLTTAFPCEYHVVGLQLQLDPSESYWNLLELYLADLNAGALRLSNNDADPTTRVAGTLPIGKPFHVAVVYAADRTASIYLDGILLGSGITTFFTGNSTHVTRLGVGTPTNNAKWFSSGAFFINRLLTPSEKTATDNAIRTLFNTEVNLAYPVYQNVSVSGSGTNTITVGGSYFSPTGVAEDTTAGVRKVLWYGAGTGGAPDVTGQVLVPTLGNLMSWTKTGFPAEYAAHKWWRPDIVCTDINGKSFGGAAGVQFYHFL